MLGGVTNSIHMNKYIHVFMGGGRMYTKMIVMLYLGWAYFALLQVFKRVPRTLYIKSYIESYIYNSIYIQYKYIKHEHTPLFLSL